MRDDTNHPDDGLRALLWRRLCPLLLAVLDFLATHTVEGGAAGRLTASRLAPRVRWGRP